MYHIWVGLLWRLDRFSNRSSPLIHDICSFSKCGALRSSLIFGTYGKQSNMHLTHMYFVPMIFYFFNSSKEKCVSSHFGSTREIYTLTRIKAKRIWIFWLLVNKSFNEIFKLIHSTLYKLVIIHYLCLPKIIYSYEQPNDRLEKKSSVLTRDNN